MKEESQPLGVNAQLAGVTIVLLSQQQAIATMALKGLCPDT